MITKLQITGKFHYHRKCDFQLSKRKLGYRTLLPLTAPILQSSDRSGYFMQHRYIFRDHYIWSGRICEVIEISWRSNTTRATWQKLQIFKIQDGGLPPFLKSLNRHISVKNCPILMKFGKLHQILNPITVSWPKIKIFKNQDGGGRHLENRFLGHNSSTDFLISAKFCTRKQTKPTQATWQKLHIFKIQDGGRPPSWKSLNHHISVKILSDFDKIWCTCITADIEPDEILKSTITVS